MIILTNQKKTNEVKRGLFFLKTIAILNEGKYIRIWKMDLGETGTYSTEGETGNTQKLSGKRESIAPKKQSARPRIFQVPIQRCDYRDTL